MKYIIEFARNEHKEEYLDRILGRIGVEYQKQVSGKTVYEICCDRSTRRDIVVALICSFYKLKELSKIFSDGTKDGAYYALMGAMLGLDSDEDAKKINVPDGKIINLDGFYDFCLSDLRESWRSEAELAHKLYVQCNGSEDVFALCVFMLGMGDVRGETLVIGASNRVFRENGSTEVEIIPYYGNEDADLIVTLLSLHPSNVIIGNPSRVSKSVLEAIRRLGEQ